MSEDNFKWNDELVKEFVNKFNNAMFTKTIGEYELEKFKASKTKAKDYEILSYINPNIFSDIPDANIINAKCSEANLAVLRNYPIHSVKRLLDGEIFELHKTRVVDPNTKHEWVISEMYVGRDNQVFLNGVWLNHVEKVKQPIPLFTTEDGEEIFEGDDLFLVVLDSFELLPDTGTCKPLKNWFKSYKPFSTKALAEEYILLNKPCLSMQDVLDMAVENDETLQIRLRNLKANVEDKISKQ